ncbi:MAG: transglycosylase SLT domain-containing protein [Desulfobaccales bacterium]
MDDEDQGESSAGEINAQHLDELYAKSGIKDRDRTIEEELKKWEHQSSFDFPIQMNKQVKAYVVYFSTERKGFTRRSLTRSSRYLPMIKEVFREYGLPEDLAYLAMVESGFNPKANSPAGACGMWQFIKGTGLRYGLVINGNVDERQDPEKSTRAAAQYLLDLYKQFGSWYLAAASYNCGEGRVQKELTKSNYKNFWELSANKCIPGETRNYVPQMIAATIIARNPQKFGFGNVPYQSPLTPDTPSNLELAQAESPAETVTPARSTKTVMPARSAKLAKLHPPPSEDDPQPHNVVLAKQKSTVPAKALNKKTNRRIYAVDKKTPDKHATKARSEPYVASLFGSPRAHAVKAQASKKGAPASGGSKAGLNRKNNKSSPALLAQKPKPKSIQLAKKKGSPKPKLSKSKSKSKALLVSQAR